MLFYKLVEFYNPQYLKTILGIDQIRMVPILKTKRVVHLFIEAFTATTIKRKVIILQVVLSWLLVMLNVKLTAELLMSYKVALASTVEDKAWQQVFYQPLAQQPS